MITQNTEEFLAAISSNAAGSAYIWGIDPGEKFVGLAVGQKDSKIASPQGVAQKKSWQAFFAELSRYFELFPPVGFVCGWPLNMDGSQGFKCEHTLKFAEKFCAHYQLPLLLWDERWTSMQAERMMLDVGTKRKKVQSKNHAVAASLILQSFLDTLP